MASDELKDENTSEKASFAELFEFYGEGLKEDVQVGDKNRGKIISIGKDYWLAKTQEALERV